MMNHRRDTIMRAVERCLETVDKLEVEAGVRSKGLTVKTRFTEPKGCNPPQAHAFATLKLTVFASARADEVMRNGRDEPVLVS